MINLLKKSTDVVNELFPASDDPTDDQINSQTSNIVVNDITSVEIPGEATTKTPENTSNPVVEIKYDNVDINSSNQNTNEDPERLKRLMTNMEVKEEVNVVKSDEIATPLLQSTPVPEPQPRHLYLNHHFH